MSAKAISAEYIAGICARIENGETPRKIPEVSLDDFIRQMLPHVRSFLEQGYSHKEIAEFLGYVSAGALRKAVEKDAPRPTEKKTKKKKPEKAAKGDDSR